MKQLISLALALVLALLWVINTSAEMTVHPKLDKLAFTSPGRAILLRDGSFGCVAKGKYFVSSDDGISWRPRGEIRSGPTRIDGGLLVEDKEGTLLLVYRDDASLKLEHTKDNAPLPGATLQVWCVRSTDCGKTWAAHRRLIDGYCGAMIDAICTRSNKLVVPLQELRYNPPRHVTVVFASTDGGSTWNRSADLDVGGNGLEDGGFEPTVAQRADGSLLMLLRTSRDRLWWAESRDDGLRWTLPTPTDIKASNSPSFLLSLQSGRLALVWNPLYPEGKKDWPRRVKPRYAERPDNVFREETCLAFSNNGGQTSTDPVVIARQPGGKLRYAYMIEPHPGEIWLALRGTWLRIMERDFHSAYAFPEEGNK